MFIPDFTLGEEAATVFVYGAESAEEEKLTGPFLLMTWFLFVGQLKNL